MNVNAPRHLPFPVSPELNTFFNGPDPFSLFGCKVSTGIYLHVKYFTLRLEYLDQFLASAARFLDASHQLTAC